MRGTTQTDAGIQHIGTAVRAVVRRAAMVSQGAASNVREAIRAHLPEEQKRLIRRIEALTGDHHSTGNWVRLVRAMCTSPEGTEALMEIFCQVEEIITRRGSSTAPPLRPSAILNKRLRAACRGLGIAV